MQISIFLPAYVQTAARILIKEGYLVYLAGGAIRDTLLGLKPDDYDLYTNATPDQMLEIFPKAISVGKKFGTVIALQCDEHNEVYEVEITTFRKEAKYLNGRWPSEVQFVDNIETDLHRRDFTINAMAVNLNEYGVSYLSDQIKIENHKSIDFTLIDLFGGILDIKNKVIKAVGNPLERFEEDALRSYRACRLASQLEFTIEENTKKAITQTLTVAKMVSTERVRDEFLKLIMESTKPSVGINLLEETGLLHLFLPELLNCKGVDQLIGHSHDVYHHLLATLDKAPDKVKLAGLFHDIGKPLCDTKDGHFYGHEIKSTEITKQVLERLKFPKAEVNRTTNLVRWHMFYYPDFTDNYEDQTLKRFKKVDEIADQKQDKKDDKKIIDIDTVAENSVKSEDHKHKKLHWSDGAVRRFINKVGLENIEDLFELRIADATSNPASMWNPSEISALQDRIAKLREQDMALKITDLAINGNDLQTILKIPAGPKIGIILKQLLDHIIEDPNDNNKEKLLEMAKSLLVDGK